MAKRVKKGYGIGSGYIGFLDEKGIERMEFPTEGEFDEYDEDEEDDGGED